MFSCFLTHSNRSIPVRPSNIWFRKIITFGSILDAQVYLQKLKEQGDNHIKEIDDLNDIMNEKVNKCLKAVESKDNELTLTNDKIYSLN